MHECPECGQACDCDGEDLWNDIGSSDWMNCTHECEDFEEDDLMPDLDELDADGNMIVGVDYGPGDVGVYACPTCKLELSKDGICPGCFGKYELAA